MERNTKDYRVSNKLNSYFPSPIGKGSGLVYKGYRISDNPTFAVKVINFQKNGMDSITTDYRVSNKLNKYFENKIKIIFSSKVDVIIVTKDDKVYKFDYKICEKIRTSNDNSEIEAALFEGLCGKEIVDFASSNSHAIALNENGRLFSWSWINSKYGIDFSLERPAMVDNTPKLVENLKNEFIQSVCCGSDHILCLTRNAEVFAWGNNEWGQIGCGSSDRDIYEPIKLQYFNIIKVIEISSGAYHCIALTSDGKAHSWGRNHHGQLGISCHKDLNAPHVINIPGILFKKVSCGAKHSLLLSENGSIYAFGSNEYYQLARKEKADSNVPIKIESSFIFTEISAHFESELSVAKSEVQNQLFVWGKSGNEEFAEPKEVDFDWLNKIFFSHHKLFYKIVEQNFNLKTKFTSNGSFKELFESEYIKRGSFGFVYKSIRKSDNETFAIKVIHFQKNWKSCFMKELETSDVIRKVNNDRLIKYYNLWFENDYESPEGDMYDLAFYIQMNYCHKAMGDMIEQINTNFKVGDSLNLLGYFIASELFVETLEGVNFLHNLEPPIIHRDLNPNNILVTYDRNGRFVKIADFGLIALHKSDDEKHTIDRGTPKYEAPEVIKSSYYTTKADIYSLGKIMEDIFLNDINK
jgi:alpha-tubulin suppressor-like RCC1 family protein